MKPDIKARIYPSLGDEDKKPGVLLCLRLLASASLICVSRFAELPGHTGLYLTIAAALIAGADLAAAAVRDMMEKAFLRENLPVLLAAAIAFAVGRGTEGALALFLLRLSYPVRDYALYRTRRSVSEVIAPDRSLLKRGAEATAHTAEDKLVFFEGVLVPADCVVSGGAGAVNAGFITGSDEKVPLKKGDFLPAGSVCAEGQLTAEAAALPEQPLYRRLAAIIEAGFGEMTETEKACTSAAGRLAPAVLLAALALIPILLLTTDIRFTEALRRAVTIIAVASPGTALLSIPLTYYAGMAATRRLGVIFGHAGAVDDAARIKAAIFNKPGTITDGRFLITEIRTDRMDAGTFLKAAAYACAGSGYPIFRAIVSAYGEEVPEEFTGDFSEIYGEGLSVSVDGIRISLGHRTYFERNGTELPGGDSDGIRVHMSVNGIYAGWLALSESIQADASTGCSALARAGVERIAMVSGDSRQEDKLIANALGIEEYHAECTAEERLKLIGEIKGRMDPRGRLAFIGGAGADERLLQAADVGVRVNGLACGRVLPSADILIMKNGIDRLAPVIPLSQRIRRYVLGGVIFSCCIKLLIIVLAALGYAPVWFGILIDHCAAFAVLLNCTGLYSRGKQRK
ncbi:MAG: HAD family hydrolase [Oscillospiraceae bacterium]|jgi:Cd2+/Zn2+-exporting ATPase|nr:HAD family hydrolase [Oscillospiraceae bacterium]